MKAKVVAKEEAKVEVKKNLKLRAKEEAKVEAKVRLKKNLKLRAKVEVKEEPKVEAKRTKNNQKISLKTNNLYHNNLIIFSNHGKNNSCRGK